MLLHDTNFRMCIIHNTPVIGICLLCFYKNISNNDNKCKVCDSICNNCFSSMLLHDTNFRMCIIYNIPVIVIYKCSFCNSYNSMKPFKEWDSKSINPITSKRIKYSKNI